MIELCKKAIDPDKYFAALDQTGAGSVVTHLGVVKPDPEGRPSTGITFEEAGDLAAELRAVEAALRERYRILDLVLARRIGRLEVGDYIFFGAVSAHDRGNAFAACQEMVERVKKLKCISKKEHFI
ncbi:MAG TPA: molybdenum cofactor biosynthesis protein MoaE [bacterium]|nr:molybdenum cofactor biosynthesis protein MoaE [bacterium]